ncbi:NUDIX domain-containing protein [Sphingobacterium sp. ML3W]|uniref:NUDIX hydrolase n=1 Tax=Sphingobacterium sp. ML3W TaxID=1538644 RepID=UPI00249B9170|nr:NUDIX domain-containing protein [Sphingobacterium sp. ML3W]WFA81277.1 NUDIX domain-containing protein [Sphingobacterium sp. ML3W]
MHRIVICSAMMLNPEGELLLVRKKGSKYFQLPGGKIAVGESDSEALVRELREELQFDTEPATLQFIGRHVTQAVNERDTLVEGYIYLIKLAMKLDFQPQAELEEVEWINKSNWQDYQLAHLAEEFVIPKWLSGEF